jgi:hypothetical protein
MSAKVLLFDPMKRKDPIHELIFVGLGRRPYCKECGAQIKRVVGSGGAQYICAGMNCPSHKERQSVR